MFEIKIRWVSHTSYFSNFRINSLSKKRHWQCIHLRVGTVELHEYIFFIFSQLTKHNKRLMINPVRNVLDTTKCFLTYRTNHSSPQRLAGEKKSNSYNHKTTIWVSHEYYLNPEFHKILSRAF